MNLKRKAALVRFLIFANIMIVIFGLVLLSNSTDLLQKEEKQDGNYTSAAQSFPQSSSVYVHDCGTHDHQTAGAHENGDRTSSDIKPVLEKGGKSARGFGKLPRSLKQSKELSVTQKLGHSFAEGPEKRSASRRSLRGSSRFQKTRGSGRQQTTSERGVFAAASKEGPAFHIDYSGPKTHPPRNN